MHAKNFLHRWKETFLRYLMSAHKICRSARSVWKWMTTITTLYVLHEAVAMRHYKLMIITFKLFMHKVSPWEYLENLMI